MNAHESFPQTLFQIAGAGLIYPRAGAALGVCFGVGAILYQQGYKEGADKRYSKGGGLQRLGHFGSLVLCVYAGLKLANVV